MKHLIETANPSGLAITEYDRLILNSTTNDVLVRGGGNTEYVDLGLSVKWAKCNLGAKTETDYGDYFQWGETTPDTDYTWATYKYCNGTYDTLTKYNPDGYYGTVNNKTTLDPEDDAARAKMGGDWRMPTRDELLELYNNTTNEWVTNFNSTGVNGRKFTSKTDKNKYIFIPASGYYEGGSVRAVGEEGCVWSSSLTPLNNYYTPHAWGSCFISMNGALSRMNRCYGQSVRGVRK